MTAAKRCVALFFFACVIFPSFIFVHECGHYLAGYCLGFHVEMHYAGVLSSDPQGKHAALKGTVVCAAGPLVNAILAATGFVWLRHLRKHRVDSAVTTVDWFATALAINAGRWLRAASLPSNPQPPDEAFLSRAMSLADWCLPYFLGVTAIVVIIAVIRLHPPGERLVPFASLFLGGVVGVFLWMHFVGPFLLP